MGPDQTAAGCDLAAARSWLASSPPPDLSALGTVAERQHADGSWGSTDDVHDRVLPTLWTTLLLVQLGGSGTAAPRAGADFLATRAATDDGVFSRGGRRDGVLACHVGIAATTYQLAERHDLAEPQIQWLTRYQDVRERGFSRRGGVELYHPGLVHRYGGCLASTTCLIGVVKAGRALELWRRTDRSATTPTSAPASFSRRATSRSPVRTPWRRVRGAGRFSCRRRPLCRS